MDLVLVKLGGSLITRKGHQGIARPAVIRRLAHEIARARGRIGARVIVGHGSGSFGHAAAAASGVHQGLRSPRHFAGVGLTQLRVRELHQIVLEALVEAGARPFSLSPSSFLVTSAGRPSRVFAEPALAALERGLTPVVYGDVVADREQGVAICSTETAFLALSRRLVRDGSKVRRAIWLGDTDGVYGADGTTVSRITGAGWRRLLGLVGGSAATDVTGGMAHRVRIALELARLGVESWILDGREPGVLAEALRGRRRGGTLVPPRPIRR